MGTEQEINEAQAANEALRLANMIGHNMTTAEVVERAKAYKDFLLGRNKIGRPRGTYKKLRKMAKRKKKAA